MVMMAGRVPAMYDAAAHTLLASAVTQAGADRDVNTAVETDVLLTGSSRNTALNAYWDNNEVPMGLFYVNIWISASAHNSSADTFDFKLEGYTSSDFGSLRTELARLYFAAGKPVVGFYRVPVDAQTAMKMLASMTHMALSCTKSHGSCSVTYTAWLSFVKAS